MWALTYRSYGANLRHLGLYVGNLQLEPTIWPLLANWRTGANLRHLGLYVGNLQCLGANNVGFKLQGFGANLRQSTGLMQGWG